MLRQHLRNNLVRIGGRWHVQSRGIPQARLAHEHRFPYVHITLFIGKFLHMKQCTHAGCQPLAMSESLYALRAH